MAKEVPLLDLQGGFPRSSENNALRQAQHTALQVAD